MKRNLPAVWLTFGLMLLGFHFVQGRKIEARETAESIRESATQAEKDGKYELALSKFTDFGPLPASPLTARCGARPHTNWRVS